MPKNPNRRALWLAAGSMLLVGVVSGSAGAQPPSHVATVTGFAPVSPPEPRRAAPAVLEDADATADPTTTLRPSVAPRTPAPIPSARVVVVPRVVVPVEVRPAGHSLRGLASYYCRAGVSICARGFPMGGAYAAAGPRLRAAICGVQSCTSWRGRIVTVNGIRVRLSDWCQCYWHQANEKVIDLYYSVFTRTGGRVTISW